MSAGQSDSTSAAADRAAARARGEYTAPGGSALSGALRSDGDAYYARMQKSPRYCDYWEKPRPPCGNRTGHGPYAPRYCWRHLAADPLQKKGRVK